MYTLHPEGLALRVPARIRLALPDHAPRDAGLYRDVGDGWEFVRARLDSAYRTLEGESRRLGRFALFRDQRPPAIDLMPPRRPAAGPYLAWALEAKLADGGSGVDARATWFSVDDRRVPSEWDSEQGTLRWRPSTMPTAGTHRVTVTATDRAGNTRRESGTFVID